MHVWRFRWWSCTIAALVLFSVGACDIPTQAPSIHTETNVDAPIVAEKTFSFLGGPKSENEPLIDTTSSTYDSLFRVADDPADISLEQRIDNFDIGSLDGVLDSAGGALTVSNSSFSEDLYALDGDGSNTVPLPDIAVYESGTLQLDSNDRVAFGNDDSFAQVVHSTIELSSATVEPRPAVFDTLAYTYPDVRTTPYTKADTLVVRFVDSPCENNVCPDGTYEFALQDLEQGFSLTLDTLQIYPDKSTVDEQGSLDFGIRGRLDDQEEVSDDDTLSVRGKMSAQDFELQELSVSAAKPFSVQVTPDADGDGNLDVADDREVLTAAFEGFKGITNRVEGLQLANVSLDFSMSSKNLTSTDAQIYTAIQGRNASQSLFLAGKQDENQTRGEDLDVSSLPFTTGFVDGGSTISLSSMTRFGLDLEGAPLGASVTASIPVDRDNSNVTDFINALPSELRIASQAEVNTDGGDLRVRKPVELDAGLNINIPLQIKGQFVVLDTIDADFSSLGDLANPNNTVSISSAAFQVRYENALPLGADVKMTIVDQAGTAIKTYTAEDGLRIDAPPKDSDGAVASPASGTVTLPLANEQEAVQRLLDGESIQLEITLKQTDGEPARLRADDTIRLDLKTDIQASINTDT